MIASSVIKWYYFSPKALFLKFEKDKKWWIWNLHKTRDLVGLSAVGITKELKKINRNRATK